MPDPAERVGDGPYFMIKQEHAPLTAKRYHLFSDCQRFGGYGPNQIMEFDAPTMDTLIPLLRLGPCEQCAKRLHQKDAVQIVAEVLAPDCAPWATKRAEQVIANLESFGYIIVAVNQ